MKKAVTFSLFIFCAAIFGVGLVYVFDPGPGSFNAKPKISGINSNATSTVLSMSEISKHNSTQSCWLLIAGKVYDVTSGIISHPGGEKAIISNCGTDATEAFDTKGRPGGEPHSPAANEMLNNYYIGDLNQTVTANVSTQAASATTLTIPSDREEDDD